MSRITPRYDDLFGSPEEAVFRFYGDIDFQNSAFGKHIMNTIWRLKEVGTFDEKDISLVRKYAKQGRIPDNTEKEAEDLRIWDSVMDQLDYEFAKEKIIKFLMVI